MSPLSITTFLLAVAAFQISAGAPQKRETLGPTATMGSLADKDTCVIFNHPYCRTFDANYKSTMFPNPRQGLEENLQLADTYELDAVREFQQFAPLLDTECSDKLGTLLCFFYFPFCYMGVTVRPCRSLCEEVARDCSAALEDVFIKHNLPGLGWEDLQQFNCSHYEFNGINGKLGVKVFNEEKDKCANNTQAPWTSGMLGPTIPATTSPKPATTAKPPTTEPDIIKEITDEEEEFTTTEENSEKTSTTTAPNEEVTCLPYTEKCPNCRIRRGVNAKTFIRNAEYNFAFRATLNSFGKHDCRWAVYFTVHETYNVKSEDCSTAPEITAGSTVVGLGSSTDCEDCFMVTPMLDLVAGEEYLVAGVVKLDEDGSAVWELAGTHSMVTSWTSGTAKAIEKGVEKGNDFKQCS